MFEATKRGYLCKSETVLSWRLSPGNSSGLFIWDAPYLWDFTVHVRTAVFSCCQRICEAGRPLVEPLCLSFPLPIVIICYIIRFFTKLSIISLHIKVRLTRR